MDFSVDKHLESAAPIGTVFVSTDSHRIKVIDTASSNTTWVDKIANKTAKTSKMTAVVEVMSIFL
jgi:hypothetical protein